MLVSRSTLTDANLDLELGRKLQLQPKGISEVVDVLEVVKLANSTGDTDQEDGHGENHGGDKNLKQSKDQSLETGSK